MKSKTFILNALLAGLIISASGCESVDENTTLSSESVSESKVSETSEITTFSEKVTEQQDSEEEKKANDTTAVDETDNSEESDSKPVSEEYDYSDENENTGNITEKKSELPVRDDEAVSVNDDKDESALKKTAFELMKKYSYIDSISATSSSVVKKDRDDVYTDEEGYEYVRCVSDNFSSVMELKSFIGQYLTGEALQKYEQQIFEVPERYIDFDNKLYCLDGGRGSGFGYIEDTLRVYDITDSGFKADIEYDMWGENVLMTFSFTGTGDKYYISTCE